MISRRGAPHSAAFTWFALAWFAVSLAMAAAPALTQTDRVLLVVNDNSPLRARSARSIFARRRVVAPNVCHIKTDRQEEISREDYYRQIAGPYRDVSSQRRFRGKAVTTV